MSCPVIIETLYQTAIVESDCDDFVAIVVDGGIMGPPGATGSMYEHVQASASALWTVNHNLGRWPAGCIVVSTGGVEVSAGITHVSINQTLIDFNTPFAGRARII